MAKKTIDTTPEIVKIHGIDINLTAVRRGKKGGKAMNKTEFMAAMPVKKIKKVDKNGYSVLDKDGKKQYTVKKHPKLEEIWDEVEKLLKK